MKWQMRKYVAIRKVSKSEMLIPLLPKLGLCSLQWQGLGGRHVVGPDRRMPRRHTPVLHSGGAMWDPLTHFLWATLTTPLPAGPLSFGVSGGLRPDCPDLGAAQGRGPGARGGSGHIL